jgi:hypothetical protein
MGTPKWYRIDKSNGEIAHVGQVKAEAAARGHYDRPAEVLKTGRFQTPFAIYALGTSITEDEWK